MFFHRTKILTQSAFVSTIFSFPLITLIKYRLPRLLISVHLQLFLEKSSINRLPIILYQCNHS